MHLIQKIEFFLVLVFLFLNLIFLFNNYNLLTGFFLFNSENLTNLKSPSNFIDKEDIEVYSDKIIINLKNYTIGKYALSGSMIPVFDSNAYGVGIKPKSPDDLNIGDIITFKQKGFLISHRIIKKGIDDKGIFFITQGDNNDIPDGKIRFSEIDSVLVILIY